LCVLGDVSGENLVAGRKIEIVHALDGFVDGVGLGRRVWEGTTTRAKAKKRGMKVS